MKYKIILGLLCVFGLQSAHAQGKAPDANGFPEAELARELLGLSFSTPETFRFLERAEIQGIHNDTNSASLFLPFESDDSRCRLYWSVMISLFQDEPGYSSENPPPPCKHCPVTNPFYGTDLAHRSNMWHVLTDILGTKETDLNEFVTVVAGKEAEERFNADSVFTFDVPRYVPSPLMKEMQFEHCTMMYISRKGRPMLMFMWLFTPDGKKNEQHYIRSLDGRVWYDDATEWTRTTSVMRGKDYFDAIQRRFLAK
jgi:hypothetical protein